MIDWPVRLWFRLRRYSASGLHSSSHWKCSPATGIKAFGEVFILKWYHIVYSDENGVDIGHRIFIEVWINVRPDGQLRPASSMDHATSPPALRKPISSRQSGLEGIEFRLSSIP